MWQSMDSIKVLAIFVIGAIAGIQGTISFYRANTIPPAQSAYVEDLRARSIASTKLCGDLQLRIEELTKRSDGQR